MTSLKPALEALRKAFHPDPNPVVRIQTEDGEVLWDSSRPLDAPPLKGQYMEKGWRFRARGGGG